MADNPPNKSGGWPVLFIAAVAVFALWAGWFFATLQQWPSGSGESLARFGQIGDTFGSLNTLFSGLAIAGVVFTLYRQHQDAKEADARHDEALGMQRDNARVAMLSSSIAYWTHLLERLDLRLGEHLRLLGYKELLGAHIPATERFGHAMFSNARHGLEFLTLATQHLGPVKDEMWREVSQMIDERVEIIKSDTSKRRDELQRFILEAVVEGDRLTKAQTK